MKRSMFLFLMLFCLAGLQPVIYAQSTPTLYFCEKYDKNDGEIGISDRFTKGYLTIMVRSDRALRLENVFIQFDKFNWRSHKFEFYRKYNYTVEPNMKYIAFTKNKACDLRFEETGFYRVFLLNDSGESVASSLIEITE